MCRPARRLGDRGVTSRDLLPANATPFERALSETSARILDVDIDAIRRSRSPNACAAVFVPLLAWERSVHFWREGDEAGNRGRVASSFVDHLAYGSPPALEAEISLDVGAPIRLREYFEVGLQWPDFLLEIEAFDDAAPSLAAAVWRSALRRKNVRDWPVVSYVARRSGALHVATAVRALLTFRFPPVDLTPRLNGRVFIAGAMMAFGRFRLEPFR